MTYRLVDSRQDRLVLLRLLDDGHIPVTEQADLIRALCAKIEDVDAAARQRDREASLAYKAVLDQADYRHGIVGHGAG